ncbi:zinc-ribbon domain-containing protein [Kribbella sp. NPDC050281]|uniref:zinc-ribbon domain-containing protein n=1 Tax=Kribbella sp. NPDC050281 TaxID=3155515 RepID=UPI0033D45D08
MGWAKLAEPIRYRPRSGEVVIWHCAVGHRWAALVSNRTNGSGCPGCQGKLSFLLDC